MVSENICWIRRDLFIKMGKPPPRTLTLKAVFRPLANRLLIWTLKKGRN
jgi:hypothetical protein